MYRKVILHSSPVLQREQCIRACIGSLNSSVSGGLKPFHHTAWHLFPNVVGQWDKFCGSSPGAEGILRVSREERRRDTDGSRSIEDCIEFYTTTFTALWRLMGSGGKDKRYLYAVTRGRILAYEEYATLLAEIEAILNSRPLTPLSNDLTNLSVLTPSHFLIGDSLILPAQKNFLDVPENRLTR